MADGWIGGWMDGWVGDCLSHFRDFLKQSISQKWPDFNIKIAIFNKLKFKWGQFYGELSKFGYFKNFQIIQKIV